MDFNSRVESGNSVVSLGGRLDAVTAPDYERRIKALMDGAPGHVVIDFERLEYISSAGLRVLLVTAKALKGRGAQLRFASVQGGVQAVFDMSGFGSMVPIDATVAAALAGLATP